MDRSDAPVAPWWGNAFAYRILDHQFRVSASCGSFLAPASSTDATLASTLLVAASTNVLASSLSLGRPSLVAEAGSNIARWSACDMAAASIACCCRASLTCSCHRPQPFASWPRSQATRRFSHVCHQRASMCRLWACRAASTSFRRLEAVRACTHHALMASIVRTPVPSCCAVTCCSKTLAISSATSRHLSMALRMLSLLIMRRAASSVACMATFSACRAARTAECALCSRTASLRLESCWSAAAE